MRFLPHEWYLYVTSKLMRYPVKERCRLWLKAQQTYYALDEKRRKQEKQRLEEKFNSLSSGDFLRDSS